LGTIAFPSRAWERGERIEQQGLGTRARTERAELGNKSNEGKNEDSRAWNEGKNGNSRDWEREYYRAWE